MPTKHILVTGGVVSSLGKGLAAASIGCLLEGHGYNVGEPHTLFADFIRASLANRKARGHAGQSGTTL